MISNSLFHFTTYQQTLKTILKGRKLRASYNFEDISHIIPNQHYVAIPMICFCDIPLKYIHTHVKRYGAYGIGFTKEWGIKNKINPILYNSNGSQFSKSFLNYYLYYEQLQKFISTSLKVSNPNISKISGILSNAQEAVMKLSFLTKPMMEKNSNNYVDREWRFIPEYFEPILNENERKALNNIYWKNPEYLLFDVNDIEHIIVPKRENVGSIVTAINKMIPGKKIK